MRKRAGEVLRGAKHVRNMREDLMSEVDLRRITGSENKLREILKSGDLPAIEAATGELAHVIGEFTPKRAYPGLRENLEILAVAVSVAMGFRTYFIQPFKIPTGSMQPTLYGIHTEHRTEPSIMDHMPLKLVKWFCLGDWYTEVKARATGHVYVGESTGGANSSSYSFLYIAGKPHKLHKSAGDSLNFLPGDYVRKGEVLWSGIVTTGDHVFVDKVRWNFRKPRRGDIMVFNTDDIASLPPGTHYIKRLVGLPGETLSIDPPYVVVGGKRLEKPPSIARISACADGYAGYRVIGPGAPAASERPMRYPLDSIDLGERSYFALGDNTLNSKDGRYWGSVPQKNLVGPAFAVYWPISRRWGQNR